VTYYCPHCWAVVPSEARKCPRCGASIEDSATDIVEKYISALRHPLAATRLRAAWMLGRMREKRAVSALLDIVAARGDHDPYLLSVAVKSLGCIGDKRAAPMLVALLADPNTPFMARAAAKRALSSIGEE